MTQSLVSWDRVRELREVGVLQDFQPKRIFPNGGRKAVVVCCGDSRLLEGRIVFLLKSLGIEVHANTFNGGVLRLDPRFGKGEHIDARAAAREIEDSVRLTHADAVIGMGDTPCKKVDEKALDTDQLLQSIFVGARQLQRHLRQRGCDVPVYPVFHARDPETVDRDRTYLLNPGLYKKLTGFDPRHV